jgi:hypothetical protein
MMQRKRLDVQIGVERYDYIKDESDRTGIPMNMIADDLLSIGMAVKRGEVIEQQSLPVIREIVQTELRKANAQLRTDMREDMQLEFTGEIKTLLRAHTDRLAALIVRTFRHANITQRLTYALLSKAHGPEFARRAFEDASEKAGRDLAARTAKEEGESA